MQLSQDHRLRFVKASLGAVLIGVVIISLLHYIVLPGVAQRLTAGQVAWLREAFKTHPGWVLFVILGMTSLLGLQSFSSPSGLQGGALGNRER